MADINLFLSFLCGPDNNRLSSYYLLINGLRHILTKTLVLNVLVVLRGLLA
jgi:hypothetical protein